MRIHLVAVGRRMPDWVETAVADYQRRLPRELPLHIHPVDAANRPKKNPDIQRLRRDEGQRLLAAVPKGARIIALDERGKGWDTPELARRLEGWREEGPDVALLVGGADGLDAACLEAAETRWSLSPLTLPHTLVRVVVAEQCYRAWSLLQGHPYHRG
ncbi:23S rRNA (pseudouridine1915-N3)-methyltransferase [Thiohalospira halophila DSM 15071]|uniref:Ribosomal RNA large subunit methyltransferase H n=1 Tax=Thiohalospira halophila DSM 15071 TaxID=1123397 RepID=A0A1I1QW43_9GAMM|nr:23S rRNA (pseudouridine(1915)-N(3))-methyltransferase RlmH [Thiohalospira halophila]SFD26212.1 23S rRNA (pseudouridine1915-N3)-methyltransferase [Thiohalospira halophila DSM 15071]